MTAAARTGANGAASSTDGAALLAAEDISVTYQTRKGAVHALDAISLDIGEGEFVSVLGPSGCGKSTLIKIFSGLLRPSRGHARLRGQAITGPIGETGIIFQQPTLLPWKTVLENVVLPARALGLDLGAARERARALLKLVALEKFADNYPYELSGGMQQRVGICRSLVHDPALLLMDEPFSALDTMTREHMSLELQSVWMSTRKSVLFITHSIPEAVFLSDRIVVMSARPGRIVENVPVELPRPRTLAMLGDPAFTAVSQYLRRRFETLVRFD